MTNPHQELIAKGKEIVDVVQQIGELIPEDSQELQYLKGQMLTDAMTLVAKIRIQGLIHQIPFKILGRGQKHFDNGHILQIKISF